MLAPAPHHRCSPAADAPLSGRSLLLHLKGLHQRASRALILGQGGSAWSHCREAIQYCSMERLSSELGEQQSRQLCCRMWILYICVLSSLTELADSDGELRPKRSDSCFSLPLLPTNASQVWRSIVAAFGGRAGDVDSEVLVPTVLLCLKLRDARSARDIVEAWLATLPDESVFLLETAGGCALEDQQQRNMAQASYVRVCELYTLHILPQLNDFTSAYDFLRTSTLMPSPARDELIRRLDLLRNPILAQRQARHRTKKKAKPAAEPASVKAIDIVTTKQAVASSCLVSASKPPRALVRRPRGMLDIARRVVRRLVSRWGITLLTMAIAAAVLRLLAQRLRLPPLLNVLARRLWSTVKMGTQVTYI
ncbi:hypothetical protein GGI20_005377 [Coemansia sp. BCRC 34301]|nr:hypothetical protein GGI20_005377 [Coemansia sp. BCRC 34301]